MADEARRVLIANIRGPKGDPGEDGTPGAQGAQGVQGEAGPNEVSSATATNLTGVLYGNGSAVEAKGFGVPGGVAAYDATQTALAAETERAASAESALNASLTDKLNVLGKGVNLLDNWYFVGGGSQQGSGQFPINQRGQTEYSGIGYMIDRWKSRSGWGDGKIAITLKNGPMHIAGVTVSAERSNVYGCLFQALENSDDLKGKTVTFSVLADNVAKADDPSNTPPVLIFTQYNGGSYPDVASRKAKAITNGLTSLTVTLSDTYADGCAGFVFGIELYGGATTPGSMDCYAVKLELGDTQTLARQDADGNWMLNDPPPNYALELLKCMRYQLVLPGDMNGYQMLGIAQGNNSNKAIVNVPIPVPFKKAAAITTTGKFRLVSNHASWNEGLEITDYYLQGYAQNSVSLNCIAAGVVQGTTYYLIQSQADGTNRMIFDANL